MTVIIARIKYPIFFNLNEKYIGAEKTIIFKTGKNNIIQR